MNDQNAMWTFHDLRLRSPDDLDVPEWRAWMIGEAHKLRVQGEPAQLPRQSRLTRMTLTRRTMAQTSLPGPGRDASSPRRDCCRQL